MNEAQVLIVGSGPSGLSVAICLQRLGISFEIVDRYGVAGGAYSRMDSKIELASPAHFLELDGIRFKTKSKLALSGEYAEYLETLAANNELEIRAAEVLSLEGLVGKTKVRFSDRCTSIFDVVILATGMFDTPVIPVLDGIERAVSSGYAKHVSKVTQFDQIRSKRILVVGAGMRGVEVAEALASTNCKVVISARKGRVRALPRKIIGFELRSYTYRFQHFFREHSFLDYVPTNSHFRRLIEGLAR